jgi:hypothetical protein
VKPEEPKCSCPEKAPRTSKTFQKPPNYTHLGSAPTLSELRKNVEIRFSPVPNFSIGLYEIIVCDSAITNSCTPYSSIFEKPSTEKVTVFYRIGDCEAHKYLVVCILHHTAVQGSELNNLKDILFREIMPYLTFCPRRSTEKRKDKSTGPKCTEKRKDKSTGPKCTCNEVSGGGTKTFGCTACVVNPTKCKFYKKPKEKTGRQKFKLKNKNNDPTLKTFCETACDMATNFVKKCAPECYQNMSDFSSNAGDCRIGTEQINIFAAVSFVADYAAHSHLDSNDYAQGATVILSLRRNPGAPAQLHYLPVYRLPSSEGSGVALDLGDGSLFIECAALETHGSSPVQNSGKEFPERVGIVCFTHASLNKADHGSSF